MLPLTLPVVGPGVPGKTMWLCVSKETELLILREWERAGEARSSPLESSWGGLLSLEAARPPSGYGS